MWLFRWKIIEFRFAVRTKLFCKFLVLWLKLPVHLLIYLPVSVVSLLFLSLANYCWQLLVWFYLGARMSDPLFQKQSKTPIISLNFTPSLCSRDLHSQHFLTADWSVEHEWAEIPVYVASAPWVCLEIWTNYSCLFDFCISMNDWKSWHAFSSVCELHEKLSVENKTYCWICSSFRNNNKNIQKKQS